MASGPGVFTVAVLWQQGVRAVERGGWRVHHAAVFKRSLPPHPREAPPKCLGIERQDDGVSPQLSRKGCLQESRAGAKFPELARVTFLSLLEQPFH